MDMEHCEIGHITNIVSHRSYARFIVQPIIYNLRLVIYFYYVIYFGLDIYILFC